MANGNAACCAVTDRVLLFKKKSNMRMFFAVRVEDRFPQNDATRSRSADAAPARCFHVFQGS